MSKCQNALYYLYDIFRNHKDEISEDDEIDVKKVKRCFDTLEKLVDQTKTPTLEELIKEWEELGYEWKENEIYIHITKRDKLLCVVKDICIAKQDKEYCCYDEDEDYSCLSITSKEHNLLTKTFRALGWEV